MAPDLSAEILCILSWITTRKYSIVCLDALTYAGNMETLMDALKNPKFSFVQGNITDRDAVYTIFEEEKPDVVVNFAAESHVDRSIRKPWRSLANQHRWYGRTRRLLQMRHWALSSGIDRRGLWRPAA